MTRVLKSLLLLVLMALQPVQGAAAVAGWTCAAMPAHAARTAATMPAPHRVGRGPTDQSAGHGGTAGRHETAADMEGAHGTGGGSCGACASCCAGGFAPPSRLAPGPFVAATREIAAPSADTPVSDFIAPRLKRPPRLLSL